MVTLTSVNNIACHSAGAFHPIHFILQFSSQTTGTENVGLSGWKAKC